MNARISIAAACLFTSFFSGCFGDGEFIYLNENDTAADASVDGGLGGNYISIRLDTSKSGADIRESISNFPLLLRLDDTHFNFSDLNDNGDGILFADSNDKILPHEIEQWDTANQKASIWVLIDAVEPDMENQEIRMYIDKTDTADSNHGVFEKISGFGAALHLAETGNNRVGGYRDSSDNNMNATGVNMNAASQITGVIGLGQYFDGSAYLTIPGQLDEPEAITLSGWISPTVFSGDVVSISDSVVVRLDAESGEIVGLFYDGTDWRPTKSAYLTDNQWHQFAYVVSAKSNRQVLYLDGVAVASTSHPLNIDYSIGYTSVSIAVHANEDRLFFSGMMDELTIHTVSRSDDWVKLCYENQRPEGQSLVDILK